MKTCRRICSHSNVICDKSTSFHMAAMVIQIKTADKNMFFIHVYRPPNAHVNHLVHALETMF